MSPQDKVERVVKEIHVRLANGQGIAGRPDLVVIDRNEMLALLEMLNQGMYEMREQYELTLESRQNAERKFKRQAEEIIKEANANAQDVYAASVIYTTDAIARVRDLMDKTNESMSDMFYEFKKALREQRDNLMSNETVLQGQLNDMADSDKYMGIIRDANQEREQKKMEEKAQAEGRMIKPAAPKGSVYVPASQPDIKVDPAYDKAEEPAAAKVDAGPEIKINTDSAYFKMKQAEAKASEPEDDLPDLDMDFDDFDDVPDEKPGKLNAVDLSSGAKVRQMNEDEIRKMVEEDELAEYSSDASDKKNNAGSILKNIIFGKD